MPEAVKGLKSNQKFNVQPNRMIVSNGVVWVGTVYSLYVMHYIII